MNARTIYKVGFRCERSEREKPDILNSGKHVGFLDHFVICGTRPTNDIDLKQADFKILLRVLLDIIDQRP